MEGAAQANFCSVFAAGNHFRQSSRLCMSTLTATFVFELVEIFGSAGWKHSVRALTTYRLLALRF